MSGRFDKFNHQTFNRSFDNNTKKTAKFHDVMTQDLAVIIKYLPH